MLAVLVKCGWGGGFGGHQAVALTLIALGLSFFVAMKAKDRADSYAKWGKAIAMVILIVSILLLVCIGWQSIHRMMGCKGDGWEMKGSYPHQMDGEGQLPPWHPPMEEGTVSQ